MGSPVARLDWCGGPQIDASSDRGLTTRTTGDDVDAVGAPGRTARLQSALVAQPSKGARRSVLRRGKPVNGPIGLGLSLLLLTRSVFPSDEGLEDGDQRLERLLV